MNLVYDWVGFLNFVFEEFVFLDFKYDFLLLESVKLCSFFVLNMIICLDMLILDDEVNFKGFGGYEFEESVFNNNLNEDLFVISLFSLVFKVLIVFI